MSAQLWCKTLARVSVSEIGGVQIWLGDQDVTGCWARGEEGLSGLDDLGGGAELRVGFGKRQSVIWIMVNILTGFGARGHGTYSDVENRTKGDESENAATPEANRPAVMEKRMVIVARKKAFQITKKRFFNRLSFGDVIADGKK